MCVRLCPANGRDVSPAKRLQKELGPRPSLGSSTNIRVYSEESRRFLPAGGATAGQWPINRPNIAGLSIQQNEDSILNHIIMVYFPQLFERV